MRVVNLAHRPFVNRRPILRVAILLWIVGAVLLAVNVRLYTGHWLGSAENRRLLAEVRQKLSRQQQVLAEKSRLFRAVKLDKRNRRAAFLNQLIDARTFPWSALFDDLEDVLPEAVRLVSVQPSVRLASNRRSRAQAERTRTAAAAPAADELAQDEVELRFNGVAQSFDQLQIFVDRLHESPFFRAPYLSNASLDPNQGGEATVFTLSAVYRTRRPPPEPPAGEPELAADEVSAPPADDLEAGPRQAGPRQAGAPPAESSPTGSRPAGSPPEGSPAGSRQTGSVEVEPNRPAAPQSSLPDRAATGRAATGRAATGRAATGRAATGPTTTGRGDTPAAGTPAAGTPSRGRSARPDARPGGETRPGLVGLPTTPPPSASEPDPPARPPTRRAPPSRVPPERRPRTPAPPRDRPADSPPRDEGPSFGDRDASSTPAILQRPRQLGSTVPAGPWDRQRPADPAEGGAVA